MREDGDRESVLVIKSLGAPPPPRRRRRSRDADPSGEPGPLPLTRATAIRAFAPFEAAAEATRWLEAVLEDEEQTDEVFTAGIALVNRALHAQGLAGADPYAHELRPEVAASARIGFASGEEAADGRYTAAREVDLRAGSSRRARRQEDLRPQERVAAILRGREQADACEVLLLRARADLDAGRVREAALQLRVGLEALLVELRGKVADPGHEEDMAALSGRRQEVGEAANAALAGELDPEREATVRELLESCERVLRRRRVLRG